jgi:hypothetical protein
VSHGFFGLRQGRLPLGTHSAIIPEFEGARMVTPAVFAQVLAKQVFLGVKNNN